MEITPLGDSALVVRVCETSADPDEQSFRAVLDALHKIKSAEIAGVLELAPAYTTIGVFFDPRLVHMSPPDAVFDLLSEKIRKAISGKKKREAGLASRSIEIPVCYDRAFAPDLDEVAAITGLSPKEVVDLHRSAQYRVNCVGFTPGFPFLSGLPDKLAVSRRATPRKEIPAGSVAIGGKQTGIYPLKSPGGWNLIGRTPVRLFDPNKNPPALLRAGDRVRFRSITRDEFEKEKP
ncbi:MAG: inhibitor of KinA [Verrucomicrobiota bacterium]